MLTAVGWGQDLTQKSVSKLNRVDLSNGGSEYCAKSHPNFLPYRDQLLCNRYVPKKGTCHGDSGGPLLIKVANSNGVVGNKAAAAWLQAGVTSFGYNILNRDSDACGAEGTISFFARIDYFISWIAQTSGMPVGQFTAPLPKQLEAK
ncbi:trypsin-like cysteine/serine peptidase domain-containing protein [Syncephalis fuscata]|nr:trypsin-like cysteine/serine peptidase domain-containing protein [Syncephalis fuscata]